MLKNYFKIAWRSLVRQKGLSFINIFGLSVGIACFSLFMLYAVNEFGFDRFHKNQKNIYRVYLWQESKGEESAHGISSQPMPMGPALKQDIPDVEEFVRMREGWRESFIKNGGEVLREDVSFADPSFFKVFSFKLRSGDPNTALNDLHSLVLTEATAEKIFGKTNPIGKTLSIKVDEEFELFTITAVAEDPPSNSSIQFKMLGNFNYIGTTQSGKRSFNNWHRDSYMTYVQLKEGSRLPYEKARLISFRKKYYPDEEEKSRKDGWKGEGPRNYLGLLPITAIHTNTKIQSGIVESVEPGNIWIVLAIAFGVLLIASINFTTLSIGRSAGRAKEIGVRKVIGGNRSSLIFQFISEAFLMALLSTLLGLLLAKILLGPFNHLAGRELDFSFTQYPELPWLILAMILVVAFLAGGYPALVLSNFKPIEVLKSRLRLGGSNFFTKSLVTVQFVLSAGLIISTLIILRQLKFMESKYPGFNKENVIVVDADGISQTKKLYSLFKQELSKHPGIIGTTSAELGLGQDQGWSMSMFKYANKDRNVYEYYVDADYLNVLGLHLIRGRNFDSRLTSDTSNSIIINEAMVQDFGWTLDNAIGQRVTGYAESFTPVVIGVVKNFNFQSFQREITPQIFQQFAGYEPFKFFVKIKPGDPADAIHSIADTWKQIAPDYPLKYSFLDENLDSFYKAESRWSSIVGWAGGISIFLACLGLFGLAALAVINRTKEIGIRKVLGASLSTIIGLVARDFLKLVLIALAIASPIAWYFMHKWLLDYPYRIHMNWWIFIVTGVGVIAIAFITIGLQAIKAAIVKPVNSLRAE